MATQKKSVKKGVAKTTSRTARAQAPVAMRSFRLSKSPTRFTSFSITRQTIYWLILGVVILGFGLWILKIQIEIINLTDTTSLSVY